MGLYAACVEAYVLDSMGNPRSFPTTLSEGDEPAFTRPSGGLRWGGAHHALEGASAFNGVVRGERVILWSGTLADGLFDRDPATWGPRGLEALRNAVETLAIRAREGGFSVLLRPHARHVLCDVQRTLKLLHEWRDLPIGLALDAASMLEVSMVREADDHFRRAYETLGPHAGAVFVTDAALPTGDDEAPMRSAPLGEGLVDADRLLALAAAHVPAEVPRITLTPGDAGLVTAGVPNR